MEVKREERINDNGSRVFKWIWHIVPICLLAVLIDGCGFDKMVHQNDSLSQNIDSVVIEETSEVDEKESEEDNPENTGTVEFQFNDRGELISQSEHSRLFYNNETYTYSFEVYLKNGELLTDESIPATSVVLKDFLITLFK